MEEINARKQIIVEATIEVLKENTIEETTVRKIAAKAGLTTGALYHHYKNKDEILFDVITQSFRFTHKMVSDNRCEELMHDREKLLLEISLNVSQRLSNVDFQKMHLLLLTDTIAKNSQIKEKYKSNYQEIITSTANLFLSAFEIENPKQKEVLASILIAAIDGITVQQALGVLPEEQDKMIASFIDFFVKSIPAYLNNSN